MSESTMSITEMRRIEVAKTPAGMRQLAEFWESLGCGWTWKYITHTGLSIIVELTNENTP